MLLLVIIATVLSIPIGILTGGRPRNLGSVRITGAPFALLSLALMVLVRVAPAGGRADGALIVASYALAAVFLSLNVAKHRRALRVGFLVLALGWGLNAAVMTANGGMPLSLAAHYATGETTPPTPGEGGFFKLVVADEHTVLRPLGDVIPLPPLNKVASAGDLVMMLGMAIVVAAGMRPRAGVTRESLRPAATHPSLPRWTATSFLPPQDARVP